jgi:hypothetical protein
MVRSWGPRSVVFLLALVTVGSQCDATTSPDGAVEFRFQVREAPGAPGRIVVRTSDPEVIRVAREQLALPESERELFINGPIAHGDGGHNQPWSWHFVPSEWEFVDNTIELCDGTPQDVEDDLDYWVDNIGHFCPWSSYVVEER